MFAYVARQPIFDSHLSVYGYELLFRNGENNCFPNIEPDEATSKLLNDSHLSYGIEDITDGKMGFINFHENTLLRHFPTSLNPRTTIIEIIETVKVTDNLVKACQHLKVKGYKLAIDDYDNAAHWQALLDIVDMVKIEASAYTPDELISIVASLKQKKLTLVVERVETLEEFKQYKAIGFDYFQGYFLAKPELMRHRALGMSKLSMLDLLTESVRPAINIDRITAIFEKDAALTFKLLRFINNPAIGKSNTITSLKHAINYMGEEELKKFIALIALANVTESQHAELLSMSLVRAKFCEIIAETLALKNASSLGYLTGLLSLIDVITSQPMSALINKLPLATDVKAALSGEPTQLNHCLNLINALEKADWRAASAITKQYGLEKKTMHQAYISSITWAGKILSCQTS
jgi:EAL and modified HD-GYP domain-containing signal transduction protein